MNVFDQGSAPALFAAVTAFAVMKYVVGIRFPKLNKNQPRYVGRIAAIWIFPIKSFKGFSIQEAECTQLGIKWKEFTDRHWTVTTADGIYLTMRQEPTMSLIEPILKDDQVQLSAPGMEPICFPVCPDITNNNLSKVILKTDTVPSVDCGDEVAEWLSRYFKRPGLRLHFSAPSQEKRDSSNAKKLWDNPAKPGDMCAFPDYCGYMMLSRASLADLNSRLTKPVPITNFRANIIIEDCEPFAEDSWSSVRIGDVQLRALDACTRCILVTIDQTKGIKDKNEQPLATLKKYRLREPYGDKPCFGINHTLDKPGKIKVGDPVYATIL
uniref:MOSC domain-containing protein n=1 Tax=Arion vulgaris TaxID=1028688 RepID=A0A0B6ZH82_9EUPU